MVGVTCPCSTREMQARSMPVRFSMSPWAVSFLHAACERLTDKHGALLPAPLQSAISEIQAPASSWLVGPSRWPDTKRERVSSCCRVLPCDEVSVLLGQRPLSKTLHTHRGWTGSFQSGHA